MLIYLNNVISFSFLINNKIFVFMINNLVFNFTEWLRDFEFAHVVEHRWS